ncbi:NAD(P)H-dependent glycerol-3-phosphate dehydrogenase [Bifidobacterium gallicum]|uniref:Glycerol-3-phosphate dehydrogenase [NAD(P)+] n=1 Tax=Bifidobacterium gallicum DSM 20093 = LMG 11596 TaxID=561180 RepID=D1NUH8_9BIFI|nr:NAD(P)H-dependent glycerol-3-phosphate dehydrogenase [Bifidobacterium gallicum]EFA23382.1 glycerol-3-phosphate dehydrogenase [NAD(P)+] [Bifidobacterium gallicum DSM 20093 = LMG 11596]KFI57865.1 glycerol-3-phosphate dehydrogenase [Bifidobacterium gallicum DSM 20093 = LMG 11596]
MAKVTVLGAGAWGTAFGQVLADAGNDVMMWAIEPEIVEAIATQHTNPVRLPSVKQLPANMTATGDRAEAVKGADYVVVAIAAQHAREALEPFKDLIEETSGVVSLMKGIEQSTGKRMDQVVSEVLDLPANRFLAVSGPNLSKQVAAREPAATVVACEEIENAKAFAKLCTTDYFHAFATYDVIGLELCGSLKNVVALAVGMVHGAGFGENTAAMVETRGLAEIKAVGTAAGAMPETFNGLAGVGDLIATCGSPLSRNYTFGANLGKGLSVEEATKVSNGVAEGVATASAVVELGKKYHVDTPLAKAMQHVLNDGISCEQMLAEMLPKTMLTE